MAEKPYSLRQRILVTDDDPDVILTLTIILQEHYEVFACNDGTDLVNSITEIEPDLLIVDAMMPNMSGYEAVEQIRKNKQFKEIPIIMLSALDTMQDHRTGYEHGVSLYLTKPFLPDILLKNVELELMKLGRPQKKKYSYDELKTKYGSQE